MPDTRADLYTHRHHLQTEAYVNDALLAARHAIYAYQQPPIDFTDWALAQRDWAGMQRILDIGCGNGRYLDSLARTCPHGTSLFGLDVATGMLRSAQRGRLHLLPRVAMMAGDIVALPLPTASVDRVLAMHMVYHVPDRAAAIGEVRRVLRPGGIALWSTNSESDKYELEAVLAAAVQGLAGQDLLPLNHRFSLETGEAVLATVFGDVQQRVLTAQLVIPDPQPILRFFASIQATTTPRVPTDLPWEVVMADVEQRVATMIAHHGAFFVHLRRGVFICR